MGRMNELLLFVAEVLDVPTTSDTAVEMGQRILQVPMEQDETIESWVRRAIALVGVPAGKPNLPRGTDPFGFLWGVN